MSTQWTGDALAAEDTARRLDVLAATVAALHDDVEAKLEAILKAVAAGSTPVGNAQVDALAIRVADVFATRLAS